MKATEHSIDTSTAAGKAFLYMLGVFPEFETNLRRERQLEGIAKAKANKGRPASIDLAQIPQLKAEGMGPSQIAQHLACASVSPGSEVDPAAHLRHYLANKAMTLGHCTPIVATAILGGGLGVKLEFCVACGSKDGLQHGHFLKGGGDGEANRITLCTGCHDKLHQQRYGARKHSQRIKTAIAARRARGASIGRPKKLMPHQCEEALKRLASGETMAALARSYGLSKSTVSRIVRSARLATNLS